VEQEAAMKGRLFRVLALGFVVLVSRCSTTGTHFTPESAIEGRSLLVGAVLVENDGIDDRYETKLSNITVVIVGQPENGEDNSRGYRVRTDKQGYFAINNVPPGSFVIKGIELDIGFGTRMIINSRWEGNRQIFIPGSLMIDFNVRVWPEPIVEPVIDLKVNYFKLDRAGRVYYEQFPSLRNARLGLDNRRYDMESPAKYFQKKYPQMDWFQR
jgi:hypothetical protein